MADDTLQSGTDTIATDHVTTLNGAAITPGAATPKVQRVKIAYGDDGSSRDVSEAFPLPTEAVPAATGTITAPASSATVVTLLAANTLRRAAYVYNDSTAVLYLALAAAASLTAYTVQVPAGGFYELPQSGAVYTGIITGLWAAANGAARVTEVT